MKARQENNERVRYLTDAEETALRRVINESYPDHLPEFEIALVTGMRRSEQFKRTWDDIDLSSGTVRLPLTKPGKCRYVHLNSRALSVMR